MIPASVATHALTAGAIGTLTLGLIARVTLGHTGRTLQVSLPVTAAFCAITASATLRVFGTWLRPDLTQKLLIISAVFWGVAFALFVLTNVKYLMTPRPDGKAG